MELETKPTAEGAMPEQKLDQTLELGSGLVRTQYGNIYILTIIGQIEGHQVLPETVKTTKYEHLMPLLAQIEESEQVDGLLLLLNTVGGDIEAGLAIAELISGMKTPSVSLVLGGGHSIGVPLAVAAQCCMIAPTAGMTIHPVRMSGTVVGAPATFQYFNRIQSQIVDFVAENSHISKKRFTEFMMATGELATDVGTVLYGKQAVDCGLIERLGSLSEALDRLHQMIAERAAQG
ncbi:MAG: ATP-dependent Clp protease proteolytic subunit [Oscillospiraceae bacterium]|nr:ATP-dependent Clp protease proteolytic subunit [Oscillospiraceae bacterium]